MQEGYKVMSRRKIVVGFKVIPEVLNILEIAPERLLGVRDLSTAPCVAPREFSATIGFSLNILMKMYEVQRREKYHSIDNYQPTSQYQQDTRAPDNLVQQQSSSQHPRDTQAIIQRKSVVT